MIVTPRIAVSLSLLLCVVAGCDWGLGSDPANPHCAAGHVRMTDGCRVAGAAVTIDGQTGDWAGIAEIPLAPACTRPPCDGLLAGTMQVALEQECSAPTCRVYFRIRLAGGAAPVLNDPELLYVLQLAPTSQRPAAEIDTLLAGPAGVSFQKNGQDVSPPAGATPYQHAWTADGFEVSIPADFLPLRGAALVSPFAGRNTGGAFLPVSDPPPVAVACWDTFADELDPCDSLAAEEVAR